MEVIRRRLSADTKASRMPQRQPALIPYREDGQLRYVLDPTGTSYVSTHDDDDGESILPLITPEVDEADDSLLRFTATGRPMPVFKPSTYISLGMYTPPQLVPQKYTDDSVIPVIIKNFVAPASASTPRRKSLIGKLKNKSETPVKVVFMPRGEYLKHFACDREGKYIGTEPERVWTEDELEASFGMYKKDWDRPRV